MNSMDSDTIDACVAIVESFIDKNTGNPTLLYELQKLSAKIDALKESDDPRRKTIVAPNPKAA